MSAALDLDELNTADGAAFVAAVTPLFEGAPRFIARIAAERPYPDWADLFDVARGVAHSMPDEEQVELIDAHPRIGAPPATVSALSFQEQGYEREAEPPAAAAAGAADEAPRPDAAEAAESVDAAANATQADQEQVAAELERLNDAYERRFGFRYCVFVAGRSRADLLPAMRAALDGQPEEERHRALDAVVDIAVARLAAMRGPAA